MVLEVPWDPAVREMQSLWAMAFQQTPGATFSQSGVAVPTKQVVFRDREVGSTLFSTGTFISRSTGWANLPAWLRDPVHLLGSASIDSGPAPSPALSSTHSPPPNTAKRPGLIKGQVAQLPQARVCLVQGPTGMLATETSQALLLTMGPCITPIWAPPAFSSKPPAIWAAKF